MSHESGDNKRLDPQLLPRPQSHPLNTAQQGQQLPRADKSHNSMRALPTDSALAQVQRSTFCESTAPRQEEKEGGLERPAWQPGEVTEVGQPAGLSALVPPSFSNCLETFSFCNCPGGLNEECSDLKEGARRNLSILRRASARGGVGGLVVFLEK